MVAWILFWTLQLAFDNANIDGGEAAMRAARAPSTAFQIKAQATERLLLVVNVSNV